MVVLKNVSKGMQIHDLSHDVVCEGEKDGCLCTDHTLRISALNPETGEKAIRLVDKTISDSVHIAGGTVSRELPDSVLKLPGIKRAVANGELVVVEPVAAPAEVAAPEHE